MKKFALALVFAVSAHGGESRYLGRLTSTGTAVSNASTGAPFVIPTGSKLTLYCDADARVLTDSTTVGNSGASLGVPVAATVLFPTSVNGTTTTVSGARSAALAMISVSGTANCDVWLRAGTE